MSHPSLLLDLPNELIVEIAKVIPDGQQRRAFAHCSSKVYHVVRPFLRVSVVISNTVQLRRYLRNVLHHRSLGENVRELSIGHKVWEDWYLEKRGKDESKLARREDWKLFAEAAASEGFQELSEDLGHYKSLYKCITLLLHFLPNLGMLHSDEAWLLYNGEPDSLALLLFPRAGEPTNYVGLHALREFSYWTRPVNINASRYWDRESPGIELRYFVSILMLPAIEKITIDTVFWDDDWDARSQPPDLKDQSMASSVRELVFPNSSISSWDELLRLTPRLRSLTYECWSAFEKYPDTNDSGDHYAKLDFEDLMGALIAHTKDSLEELNIWFSEQHGCFEETGLLPPALRELPLLKTVGLPLPVALPEDVPLVDFLPPWLEVLTLRTIDFVDSPHNKTQILELLKAKYEHMPKLTVIHVDAHTDSYYGSDLEWLKKPCLDANVRLSQRLCPPVFETVFELNEFSESDQNDSETVSDFDSDSD